MFKYVGNICHKKDKDESEAVILSINIRYSLVAIGLKKYNIILSFSNRIIVYSYIRGITESKFVNEMIIDSKSNNIYINLSQHYGMVK